LNIRAEQQIKVRTASHGLRTAGGRLLDDHMEDHGRFFIKRLLTKLYLTLQALHCTWGLSACSKHQQRTATLPGQQHRAARMSTQLNAAAAASSEHGDVSNSTGNDRSETAFQRMNHDVAADSEQEAAAATAMQSSKRRCASGSDTAAAAAAAKRQRGAGSNALAGVPAAAAAAAAAVAAAAVALVAPEAATAAQAASAADCGGLPVLELQSGIIRVGGMVRVVAALLLVAAL
jgi:hypothetical protein